MKTGNPLKVLLAAALAFILVEQSFAANKHDVVEQTSSQGVINWSQGVVLANGTGMIPDKSAEKAPRIAEAQGQALYGYTNLLKAVEQVRINASCQVKDLVQHNEMLSEQLRGMIKAARVVRREYLSDGTVQATLAFSMTGGFAQLALPQSIKPVPEIKTISGKSEGGKNGNSSHGTAMFTGLVLDARGLKGVPAMAPTILNESGDQVYGPAMVSREYAVQQGMVAFERNLDCARNNPRVMDNPIIVRALRTQGTWPCNFIISDTDGSTIRSASENLLFLKQCRVVIVLD